MKKSRFTEEQIECALKQVELGMAVGEVCRKDGCCGGDFLRVAEEVWLIGPVRVYKLGNYPTPGRR